MDALRPRLRKVWRGLLRELLDPALELLQVPREPAPPELDAGRVRSELRLAGRLDALAALRARPRRSPGRTRPGPRSCAGAPRGSRTSSPSPRRRRRSPAGRCTRPPGPASTASRSGPGKSVFQSSVSPPISVGWQAKLATTAIGLPSSASTRNTGTLSSTGRSRRTLLTLIPGARPVPQPTRAGRRAAPGRVDGARELVGQSVHPRRERAGVGEPRDRGAARDARRAVVVRGVHEHGLGRDPGQLLHALAHRGRHVRAGEDEVEGDDRDRVAAVVEDERLRDQRLADALGEAGTGRPAAVRQAAGRGDVGARDAGGQSCSQTVLSHCWATSSAYASGRRFLSANHGFSRACSTSAGSSSTAIHWSPVPGSDCAIIDPSGART